MARLRSKRSALRTLSCKFGGIGKNTPLSPAGAEDMCNFRILPGGILKTRMGYQFKKKFLSYQKIRGIWEGTVGDLSLSFTVAGDKIYRLQGDNLAESIVGSVTSGQTPVHFCVYLDNLYLLDGTKIYHYFPVLNQFKEMEAYVPLYGYQWHPTSYGEVYEEINLLSPRLRVHYYNPDAATVFQLPYYAETIDVVRINGKESTAYEFSPGSKQITATSTNAPVVFEVGFTVSLNEEIRQKILSAQLSFIYEQGEESKLFLWGNDPRVFYSRYVADYMLSSCHVMYPRASSLYFCADDVLFLGDSLHPVTVMCPLYDTILAFTDDRIWNISFGKEGIETKLATAEIGCAFPFGAIPYQNDVVAVMGKDIYRISASVARPEQLSLERLSAALEGRIAFDFLGDVHLFWNVADGEIWIRDTGNQEGEVLVWNTESNEWYRFDNIDASFFFKIKQGFGFVAYNIIFLFNRSCGTDYNAPIAAFYRSAYLDFGTPDLPRRSTRAYLYSGVCGEGSSILFETERSEKQFALTDSPFSSDTQLRGMRIGTHRYRFLRFTLFANTTAPAEFYRLDIHSLP